MEVAKLFFSLSAETQGMASELAGAKSAITNFSTSSAAVIKAAFLAAFLAVGVAMAQFAGDAINAARDFESAFASLSKTTDGLVDDFGNLTDLGKDMQDAFRGLAKEIPVSVNELLELGGIASQLGIGVDDVVMFTEAIAQMGVATDLTAEAAATSFAQIGNVMKLSTDDIIRMASSVVELGNNMATSESAIVNFAQRIAGAGAIAGLTAADVAAIGAAFSSVGVGAEAGGTAVQKVLLGINTALVTGSDEFELYAQTAGMSAADFADAWENDAGAAFTLFVEGLGVAGDEAILILEELGLTDQRLIKAFLSLAGAGDLLSDAMEMSNQAFKDNTALAAEAEVRFGTVDSKVQLLKNTFNDFLLVIGLPLLDAYGAMIDATAGVIDGFTTFFGAVQQGVAPIEALKLALTGLIPDTTITAITNFILQVQQITAPIIEAVTSFFTLRDAVIALGLMIGSALLPFLGAFIGAIGSVLVALAPIVITFIAITTAVAALRTAWETNFLGIRDIIDRVREAFQFLITAIQGWGIEAVFSVFEDGSSILDSFFQKLGMGEEAARAFANILISQFHLIKSTIEVLKMAVQNFVEGIKLLLTGDVQGAIQQFAMGWETASVTISAFFSNLWGIIEPALANLLTGIQTWFASIPWATYAQTAFEQLRTAFSGIGQTIGETLANALTGLAAWLGTVDWAGVGSAIINGIIGGVVALIGLLITVGTAIVSAIGGFLGSADWIAVGTTVITAIANALVSLATGIATALVGWYAIFVTWAGTQDWAAIAQTIVDMISTHIMTVGNSIADALAGWYDIFATWAGSQDWAAIGQTVVDFVTDALMAGAALIGDAVAGWRDSAVQGAEDMSNSILETIESKISELADNMRQWGEEAVNSLIDGLQTFATNGVTAMTDGIQAIQDAWNGIDWYQLGFDVAFDIGTGLKTLGETIATTVEGWGAAFDSFFIDTDWQGKADALVADIVAGLSTLASEIATTVEGWGAAFDSFFIDTDWQGKADALVADITAGLTKFATEAAAIIEGWGAAFDSFFIDTDWEGKAESITTRIGDTLRNFFETIGNIVTDWYNAFVSAATAVDWGSIGKSILEGIGNGILAYANNLYDSIRGVADGIRAAFSGAIEEGSPARLFIPSGIAIPEGIAVGITQGSHFPIDAILQLAQDIDTEGAKAFGEAVQSIADSVMPAIEALIAVMGFTMPDAAAAHDKLESFAQLVKFMVAHFAGVASFLKRNSAGYALDEATELANAAQHVSDAIMAAIEALNVLSTFTVPDVASQMAALAEQIQLMVGYIAAISAAFSVDILAHVMLFVDTALQALDLIREGIAAVSMLSELKFSGDPVGVMGGLAHILRLVVERIVGLAGHFNTNALVAISNFTSAAIEALGLIQPGIDAVSALSELEFSGDPVGVMGGLAHILRLVIERIVGLAGHFNTGLLGHVIAFTEAARQVLELIQPGIDAVSALATLTFRGDPVGNLQMLADFIQQVVEQIAVISASFSGEVLAHISAFVESATAALGLITQARDALEALSSVVFPTSNIGGMLDVILSIVTLMITKLEEVASGIETEVLAAATAFAESAGSILDIVQQGAEALSALGTLSGMELSKSNVNLFVNLLILTLDLLVDGLESSGLLVNAAVDAAADASESLQSIIDIIKPGVDALISIIGFSGVQLAKGAVQNFVASLILVVTILNDGIANSQGLIDGALAESAIVADSMKALIDIIKPGVEGLQMISQLTGLELTDEAITIFVTSLIYVVTALKDGIAESVGLIGEALAVAALVADDMKEVIQIIKPGVDALESIGEFVGVDLTLAAVESFVQSLIMVVIALKDGIANAVGLIDGALGEASIASESINNVVGLIKPGIDALAAIATFTNIDALPSIIDSFVASLILVVMTLKDGIQEAGEKLLIGLEFAGMTAERMQALLDIIAPGLDAIAALAEFVVSADISTQAQAFIDTLIDISQILVSGLELAAKQIGIDAIASATELANAILALSTAVESALNSMIAISDLPRPDLSEFGTWLTAQATAITAALIAAQAALGTNGAIIADSFKEALQAILASLEEALVTMAEIISLNSGGGTLQALLDDMIAAMQTTVDPAGLAGRAIGEAFGIGLLSAIEASVSDVEAALADMISILESAESAATNVGTTIGEAFGIGLLSAIEASVSDVEAALADMISILESAENPAAKAGTTIGEAFGIDLLSAIEASVSDVEAALADMISILESAENPAANAGTMTGNAWGQALLDAVQSAIVSTTSTIADGLNNAGTVGMTSLVSAVQAMIPELVSLMRSAGEQGVQALADAIQNSGIPQGAISALIADIVGAFSSAADQLYNVGTEMINGLVGAIQAGQSSVVSAMIEMVQAAVASAEGALGISSPSKVFQEIGRFALAGFVNAFKDTNNASSSIANSLNALVTSAEKSISANVPTPSFAGQNAFSGDNSTTNNSSVTNNNTYIIQGSTALGSEGDLVKEIRALRLLGG